MSHYEINAGFRGRDAALSCDIVSSQRLLVSWKCTLTVSHTSMHKLVLDALNSFWSVWVAAHK